jgi:hypothetical protein
VQRFRQQHPTYDDYLRAFSQTRIPLRLPSAAPNLEPRDDIWADRCSAGYSPDRRRPRIHPAPLGISGAGIALLRVYGKKSPKTKWKFTKTGEDWSAT